METTSRRWVHGAGNVAFEDYASSLHFRVRERNRHEESLRVWVKLPDEESSLGSQFDDLPEIHNRNVVTNVLDDAQVVRDEEIG